MLRIFQVLLLLAAVGATAYVLHEETIPLGVPGEWTWDRIPIEPATRTGAAIALLAGVFYIGFALLGARRMQHAWQMERYGWFLALIAASFAWMYAVVDATPPPHDYGRAPWVLYYPRSSGYFAQARYEVENSASFLAGYEESLEDGDYLHIGTHPPGLTLGYYELLRLLNANPSLTRAVLKTQPPSVREAVATIREAPIAGEPLTAADEACLWLAVLITQLAAVLTCWGVYALAVRHVDRPAAWLAACVWPLVPATLVFLPKSDVLYAFLAVAAAGMWMSTCDRGSILRAMLTGLIIWLGMFLSLAFVAVAALMAVMTIWETATRPAELQNRPFLEFHLLVAALIGFAIPTATLWLRSDINLLNVWWLNFTNHAEFYEHNVRTPSQWLNINGLEMAFAVGLPVVVCMLVGIWRLLRLGLIRPHSSALIAFVLVWGGLLVSGKNMGEAARLWILVMPWAVLIAAHGLTLPIAPDSKAKRPPTSMALGGSLLLAQCLVAVMTIMRVDGFHFGELLGQ